MKSPRFSFGGFVLRWLVRAAGLPLLAMGLALWVGARLPALADESLITRAGCFVPCTFGIVPGSSDRESALAAALNAAGEVLRDQSDARFAFTVFDAAGRGARGLVTFGYMQNRRVSAFSLFKDAPDVNIGQLGDLLLAGYRPNRVYRSCDGMTPRRLLMTFGIEDRLMVELLVGAAVDVTTEIALLEVYAPNSRTLGDARASFGCSVEVGWHGFAPLWRYFRVSLNP